MHTVKPNTPVTVDDLALMINKGFKETAKNLDDFKIEVRAEFKEVHLKFKEIDAEFKQVHSEFKQVHAEFKEVKGILRGHTTDLIDQDHRITKVEKKLQIA